jgi:hypothetical protein
MKIADDLLDIAGLTYTKETRTFTAELSDLEDFFPGRTVRLVNSKTGEIRTFYYSATQMDATNEDVLAWHYKCGDLNLTLIND